MGDFFCWCYSVCMCPVQVTDLRFWVQHASAPPRKFDGWNIQNDAIFGKRYIFQTMVFGIYVGLSLSLNCWVILGKSPAPTKPPFTQSLPAAASATQPPTHPAVAMERPIGNHTVAWNERFLLVTSHRSVAAKSMITSHQPKCAILGIQSRISDWKKFLWIRKDLHATVTHGLWGEGLLAVVKPCSHGWSHLVASLTTKLTASKSRIKKIGMPDDRRWRPPGPPRPCTKGIYPHFLGWGLCGDLNLNMK